jgi:hypothetical protein
VEITQEELSIENQECKVTDTSKEKDERPKNQKTLKLLTKPV